MQKILLLGLDGAGKTALYQKYFQKKLPEQLKKILPTRGIAKYEHDFLRSDFVIFDTGGGKKFRQQYIGNQELVQGLKAVVFVIDVQDTSKFEEAANFFGIWIKSVLQNLKGVKGYMLFNKIDPGTEGQVRNNLAQLAPLMASVNSLFPSELHTSITTIYNDSPNQLFQRMLLDLLPKKMSKPKAEPVQPITTPPPPGQTTIAQPSSFMTKPVKIDTSPSKLPPKTVTPPPKQTPPPPTKQTMTPTVKPPTISPPSITSSTHVESPATKIAPPSIGKKVQKASDDKKIKEKTAERLTDIIEQTLGNNPNFVAIAVYSDKAVRIVGAVKEGANQQILTTIETTLSKINLEDYMQKLGKVRIGGEGHIKIETFDIFFEKVAPEEMSTVICSSIAEDTIKNIAQLNKYLNQALSVTPEGVSDEAFKRSDLMAELKMRLHTRGKSVDELL